MIPFMLLVTENDGTAVFVGCISGFFVVGSGRLVAAAFSIGIMAPAKEDTFVSCIILISLTPELSDSKKELYLQKEKINCLPVTPTKAPSFSTAWLSTLS